MRKAILFGMLVLAVLMIAGCKTQETTQTTPTTPTVPEVTTTESETPAPTETPAVTEEGVIAYGTRGILSDVQCKDGKISGIITNVKDAELSIQPSSQTSDLIIQINGMRIQDFTCDKTTLKNNEYTYCSDMMGKLSSKLRANGNEVAVWFKSDIGNRGTTVVDC